MTFQDYKDHGGLFKLNIDKEFYFPTTYNEYDLGITVDLSKITKMAITMKILDYSSYSPYSMTIGEGYSGIYQIGYLNSCFSSTDSTCFRFYISNTQGDSDGISPFDYLHILIYKSKIGGGGLQIL